MHPDVRVVRITAGPNFAMALTDDGKVFTVGNTDWGQLGHRAVLIDGLWDFKWAAIKALRDVRVVAMEVGRLHSILLTDTGDVFTFGEGVCGQLGHGNLEFCYIPKKIKALSRVRVVSIAAGGNHSMVLTNRGDVMSFGMGSSGQLGLGDRENRQRPTVIKALFKKRVVAMTAGDAHAIVLTDEGTVFSFGYGGDGSLGHGDEVSRHTPVELGSLKCDPCARKMRNMKL